MLSIAIDGMLDREKKHYHRNRHEASTTRLAPDGRTLGNCNLRARVSTRMLQIGRYRPVQEADMNPETLLRSALQFHQSRVDARYRISMIQCNQSRARQAGQANTQARQVKPRHGILDARMPADNYAMWPCQSIIADPGYNIERRLRVGVRPTRRRHDPEDSSGTRLLTSCASARVLPTSGLAAAHGWTLELGQAQWAPDGDGASLFGTGKRSEGRHAGAGSGKSA